MVPTLADEKRQATLARILRLARLFVADHGLDVTVEEIAEAAGVSRRTLFRHFPTRDQLIAAAISAGLERYGELLPSYSGGDWRTWLGELCRAVHRMNDSCGPGFWELATRHDLPPELSAIEQERRRARREVMTALATTLWSAAGGPAGLLRQSRPPSTSTSARASPPRSRTMPATTGSVQPDWPCQRSRPPCSMNSVINSHQPQARDPGLQPGGTGLTVLQSGLPAAADLPGGRTAGLPSQTGSRADLPSSAPAAQGYSI